MKKRHVQKMLTMALTAAVICSSVPVSAETVSENETAVTVDTAAEQEMAEKPELEADQAETKDTEVEDGKEGYLSYCIYQKPDETKYVEITKCDYNAKGVVEIPTKIKDIKVTSIGNFAFSGCSGLTGIEIPSSVTSIRDYAFSSCSGLTGIEIPSSVTKIGEAAFSGCSGLTSINVEAGNEVYDSRDNCNAIIKKATNTLIQGCKNTKIPSSVTSIGYYAFYDCSGLTGIEIPSSVTSIGDLAFWFCSGLKDVYYTGTQEQWNAISFGSGGDVLNVFGAYDEDLRQNISIPFTLHCNYSRPKPDVPAAGTSLKEKTGREFKVTESDGSESKPSVTLTKLSAKEKKAKKVTIPKTVTINNVKYQVTGIAAKTFKNSKKLQTVVIPDTVTEIGTGSFEGCKKLKSVTIGKNVTSIGKNAFKNCKNLKKITVKSTKLKKVGKGALTGINRKCVIKVPKKQLKSYKRLFKGKGQKKSVKIKK